MRDAVICEPLRTPVGGFGGSLRDVPAAALASGVIRALMERTGLPPEAIDEVRSEQVATANEVEALVQVATARQWKRLIVVTSKLHTARSALAMRRRFEPLGKEIIMRASRYDTNDIAQWWSNRSTFRFVMFEAQKYVAYAIGIGD